jgi:transposase
LAFLLFLVGYWPDLAPIEEAFSKLKTALRRTGARTREALEEAIAESVTHDHGSGCLRLVPALWLPRF